MSGRGRNRGNRKHYNNQPSLSSVARQQAASLPSDSPLLAMFKQAAVHLNERQDRHERLVKLSRDITIESKRIIFLLHSTLTKDLSTKVIEEAKDRLQKVVKGPIKSIGLELEHSPAYLHSRAVTAGLQEFVEALTLCSVMEKTEIVPYADVQKELTFEVEEAEQTRTVVTLLPQNDYMLGLADLTGELMRRAINSISSGDSEDCFLACQVVRDLFTGYLGLFGIGKELGRKMNVTRANLHKVEHAVYALRVRGGGAPLPLLGAWEGGAADALDVDEGFY